MGEGGRQWNTKNYRLNNPLFSKIKFSPDSRCTYRRNIMFQNSIIVAEKIDIKWVEALHKKAVGNSTIKFEKVDLSPFLHITIHSPNIYLEGKENSVIVTNLW